MPYNPCQPPPRPRRGGGGAGACRPTQLISFREATPYAGYPVVHATMIAVHLFPMFYEYGISLDHSIGALYLTAEGQYQWPVLYCSRCHKNKLMFFRKQFVSRGACLKVTNISAENVLVSLSQFWYCSSAKNTELSGGLGRSQLRAPFNAVSSDQH